MELSKYRRWTSKEDARLIRLYQKKTLYELAAIFNRHWNKVGRRAVRLGLKKDKGVFAREISKAHKKLFREGKRSNKGNKNPNWKGGNRSPFGGIPRGRYITIHDWIRKYFGKAYMCENTDCVGFSKSYSWAKKKECEYEKNRDNFMMLCRSCHTKYDIKNEAT